jgi:hypothetical protein
MDSADENLTSNAIIFLRGLKNDVTQASFAHIELASVS